MVLYRRYAWTKEKRVVKTRSTAGTQQNKTRRRPRRIAGEPEDTRMDSNRIPPSKRRKKEPQGKAKTKKYADRDAAGDRIDRSGCWGPDFLEAIWLIE